MVSKKRWRHAELQYEFDRLLKKKMEQVYDILLAKIMRDFEKDDKHLVQREKAQ